MLTRKQLQPPFRQRDLLTVGAFISYRGERGISSGEKQLEFYEKKKLLLPAVGVKYGFVECRKILLLPLFFALASLAGAWYIWYWQMLAFTRRE